MAALTDAVDKAARACLWPETYKVYPGPNSSLSSPSSPSAAATKNKEQTMSTDVFTDLANYWASIGMGMPVNEDLVQVLRDNLTEEEAEVARLLPDAGAPLNAVGMAEIASSSSRSAEEIAEVLERLADRGLIFSRVLEDRSTGYALHQVGFGFPQAFFWKGEDTPHARKMTAFVRKYFNRKTTEATFGGRKTKTYRYIPIEKSVRHDLQAVMPHDRMDTVLDNAERFALAQCPCRVGAELAGHPCEHPKDVCLKFDEMAVYLIERGLGKEIDREEARRIVNHCAEIGLVHFVDNAAGKVKHNCNCCGCACWNVGAIRRRKISRDALMAVYFFRETDPDKCVGCEACVDICPVVAITMEDGLAVVDKDWCIGCGVCATRCDFDALKVVYRDPSRAVPKDFNTLHATMRGEDEANG